VKSIKAVTREKHTNLDTKTKQYGICKTVLGTACNLDLHIHQVLNTVNDKGQNCDAIKGSATMRATITKNRKSPNHKKELLLVQEGTEIKHVKYRILNYLHCLIIYMLVMIMSSSGKITDTTTYICILV
jgi:phosphodiesterase/alkaline phosphatase D-like protein